MGVKMTVGYQGDLICKSTHGPSGNSIITEAPVDNGGQGRYFSPTDLVGAATASCMLTVIGIVAQRNNLDVSGMSAEVEKEIGIPIISKIPILGRFFTNRSKVKDQRVLLILVTPTIILQDEAEAEAIAAME